MGKLKSLLSGAFIDYALAIVFVLGSIYAYDQYKEHNNKIYIVDAKKVFDIKQETLDVSSANEKDVENYYDSLEKLVKYSNAYINAVSTEKDVIVYAKNAILTTKKDGSIVDLTDDLILKLRSQNLL